MRVVLFTGFEDTTALEDKNGSDLFSAKPVVDCICFFALQKASKNAQETRTKVAKAARKTGGGINPIGESDEICEESDRSRCLSRPHIKLPSRFDSESKP